MIKHTIQITIIFYMILLSATGRSQTIYNQGFTTIDGGTVSLSTYAGKKIIFITVPTNVSDSATFDDIKRFQTRYGTDSIKLVGIMSIEDGFADSNAVVLKNRFQSEGISIVLTQGMHIGKSSGSSQAPVMKWLTHATDNNVSDMDAMGIGNKFFVNKAGKLVGVIYTSFSMVALSVSEMLTKEN